MNLKKEIANWGCCLLLLCVIGTFSAAQAAPPSASPPPVGAVNIADYTAFPPFLPRVVSPNILFLLDFSSSMLRPAYGDCNTSYQDCRYKFFNHNDDYDPIGSYAGYYLANKRYSCTPGLGIADKCVINAAGDFSGNWLNWLATTQFDVMKKVVVGGDFNSAPETGNPTLLSSKLTNATIPNTAPPNQQNKTAPAQNVPTYREFYKVVSSQACLDNSPDALCDTTVPQRIPYKWIATPASLPTSDYAWYNEATYDVDARNFELPFTVTYMGRTFSNIAISDNAFVVLKNDTSIPPNDSNQWVNNSLPFANDEYNNLIAVMWDDLSLAASPNSYVSKFSVGTAPHRIFVVTWNNIYPFAYPFGGNPVDDATGMTMQLLLFESPAGKESQVVMQFKDVVGPPGYFYDYGTGATTGLQDESTPTKLAKQFSFLGSRPLENELAVHMTYGQKIFRVAPEDADRTNFRPAGEIDTSASTYHVNITVNNATATAGVCAGGYILNKINGKCYDHPTEGLLQEFRDGEMGGLLGFRLAVMKYNQQNGGVVAKHFNDTSNWTNTIVDLRNQIPTAEAPIAEALHMAQGYFRQVDTGYNLGNTTLATSWNNTGTAATCSLTGNNYDPFCYQSAAQKVPCAKSYVLLVSSGNYSHDFSGNIYDLTEVAGDKVPLATAERLTLGEVDSTVKKSRNFGGLLDNIAYQMHAPELTPPDLRADIDGNQTVGLYAVNTFGAGSGDGTAVLKRAALYGGFKDANGDGDLTTEDVNGNCILDAGEDVNNNGRLDAEDNCTSPASYFEASGGGDLRSQIVSAVTDILKNSASGTSVSVLSTSAGGEGALYQAYFYPAKILNQTEERRWPGYMRAFFIDRYQNLHDDYSNGTTPDGALVLEEDHVTRMRLNPSDNAVVLDLFTDSNGDGVIKNVNGSTEEDVIDTVTMDEVASLWEAGASLAGQDKSNRHIYLWLDRDGDGQVEDGAGADFSSTFDDSSETLQVSNSLAADLVPYLRAQDNIYDPVAGYNVATDTLAAAEATNLIDFLVGNHVDTNVDGNHQNYRNRCLYVLDPASALSHETGCSGAEAPTGTTARVWPLGDIVFSTPTLVAGPTESYDKIYNDADYIAFRNLYKNRRNMVYVGANDGLLHAFNAGVYKQGDDYTTTGKKEFGWFIPNPTSGNGWTSPVPKLGDELWAFLPYDNLPHLPWLTCNGTEKDAAACYNSEYTHVYYADQRPKVTDVRMFNDAATSFSGGIEGQLNASHPGGWGTILILPLRFGGGAMDVAADFDGNGTSETRQFRSAYYAFDITDAEKPPKLLWRFTHANLGFSTSYPAIAHIKSGGTEKWFMVVGSGPDNNPPAGSRAYGFASSAQNGNIFIVDLANGSASMLDADPTISARQVMSEPTVIDVDRDFNSDVIYIGSTINPTGNEADPTYGRIYRINTRPNATAAPDLNPANWVVSLFADADPTAYAADPDIGRELGPVVVAPSASKDNVGNLWVYFGTGQLRNRADMNNSDQQRFYGVKDFCWKSTVGCSAVATATAPAKKVTTGLADLMNTSNVKVFEISPTLTSAMQVQIPATDAGANSACGLVAGLPVTECSYPTFLNNVRKKNGWYVNLINPADPNPSERVLSKSSVLGGVVLFTSYKPSGDLCSIFGDSYLNSFYYETGAAFGSSVIGSKLIDSSGNVMTDANGQPLQGDLFTRNASGQLVAQEGSGYAAGTVMAADIKKSFDTRTSLGQGMPTSVGLAVGESTTGFVQQSTGEIKQIRTDPVFKIKSGPTSWREQPTGDGTSGVEMIYRHISK